VRTAILYGLLSSSAGRPGPDASPEPGRTPRRASICRSRGGWEASRRDQPPVAGWSA
jgi:hypothetical protein